MTATTEDTVYSLPRYEQGRQSYPWSRRNKTILTQSDSQMLLQIITDGLQHTCHQVSFDQIDKPSAPKCADLIILALRGPTPFPLSPSPEPMLPGKPERPPS